MSYKGLYDFLHLPKPGTRVGLVNRSEATVKIGFVDTVNRLTALVINLETNTV